MTDDHMIHPHDCGQGNHEWSDEPLEDGSYHCENPGCAMFLFPEEGAVAVNREAAKAFQKKMEALNDTWPPEDEDFTP